MSDPIVSRLSELGKGAPELCDAAAIYGALIPVLREAELGALPLSMTPDEVRLKISHGRPVLADIELALDTQAVSGLLVKLALSLEKAARKSDRLPVEAGRIRLAVEGGLLDVAALLAHTAAGERGPIDSMAHDLKLDPALVLLLARNALKPALRAWRRQLTAMTGEISWDRGDCPICGAVATLAEFQGNNQARRLRCGQCGADWQFSRMKCIYCGNDDHRTLGFLYPEGRHNSVRVEVCEVCHGYLKVITAFSPNSPEMLPVEDLATLHLDYIALEHGYSRHNNSQICRK